MFDLLLKAMAEEAGLDTSEARVRHLQDLREPARQLWECYQNQDVRVDYSDPQVQYAYMLRYFPFYVDLLPRVLGELPNGHEFPHCELANAAFFGCGPAPEVIGFLSFLAKNRTDTIMASCTLVDSAPKQWDVARQIAKNVIPDWDPDLRELIEEKGCITEEATFRKVDLASCQLVVFQNCLNEIPIDRYEDLKANIRYVFSKIPHGALVVFIDRSGYKNTNKFLDDLKNCSESANEAELVLDHNDTGDSPMRCEMSCKKMSCKKLLDKVPPIVTKNLFHRGGDRDGLMFAESISYVRAVFQRSTVA